MKLYLIRHAESVGNINGNLTATTDFELTDKGVKQAKRLGEALKKELAGKTVQAYCSPLSRAKQTMNEIEKNNNMVEQNTKPYNKLTALNAIKNKFIANIILNGESFKVFPLRPGIRYMCLISPILFNIVLQVLVRVVTKD